MPRDVGAAAGLGDGERADRVAGQRRPDEPVDEVGVAAGGDVGQRDAGGEQPGHQAARRAGVEHRLLQHDAVEQVAATAADLLGERDAEQAVVTGRAVQRARDLAGVLPLLQVRRDLAADELGRGRPQRVALLGSFTAGPPGCATHRERSHSPSPLACGSNRVDAATPWPSRPWTTTLTAPRLGSSADVDVEVGRLGQQLADAAWRHQLGQPGDAGVVRRRVDAVVRDPEAEVGVAALVARARVDERAQRQPSGQRVGVRRVGRRAPAGSLDSTGGVRRRVGDDLAAAVGVDDGVRDGGAVDVLGAVDAVRRGGRGRRGHREAGVRRRARARRPRR